MHLNHDKVDAPTPDQRLREVARILAGGVLRFRARVALPAYPAPLPGPQILGEIALNPLDVPGESRLSVHPG
jgi:hypothetical protein